MGIGVIQLMIFPAVYNIEIQSQFECKCDGMLCSLVGHKSYVEMSLYH